MFRHVYVTIQAHVVADFIILASMLRIPVSIHNVPKEKIYRPQLWEAFGLGEDDIATDYRACKEYAPLFK
jgi:L-fucose isomerase